MTEKASLSGFREFPREVPRGVGFLRPLHDVLADPEVFAAPRCPVLRIEEASR